jgi:hypothetical protein
MGEKTYSPLASAFFVNCCPDARFCRLTMAPETTAPEGSLTLPRNAVFAVWVRSGEYIPAKNRDPASSLENIFIRLTSISI